MSLDFPEIVLDLPTAPTRQPHDSPGIVIDAQVSVAEAELLRVVCASLHCPLPPMLEAPASRLS